MDAEAYNVFVINAAFNVLFCLTATFGNAVVLAALPKVTCIHAPSKALLGSLALSDLAVGILIHPSAAAYLIASITANTRALKILGYFFTPLTNYIYAVSLLTVAAISVDRFLAVHRRSDYRVVVSVARVRSVIAAVWVFPAVIVAVVVASGSALNRTYDIIDAVYYSVCVFTPGVLYSLIYKKLRQLHKANKRHYEVGPARTGAAQFNIASYQRSVVTMFLVYGALLFSYLPRIVLVVLNFTGTSASLWLGHFSATLILFNSSLNPAIYCWRVAELRKIVRRMLCGAAQ